jgi:hypothetical protein
MTTINALLYGFSQSVQTVVGIIRYNSPRSLSSSIFPINYFLQFNDNIVLTLSLLKSHICGVSKKFGEWYQKTNKTEDTNKLPLLAFKVLAILHNTLLATFIKRLETVSIGYFRNRSQNSCHTFLDCRRAAAIQG